MKNSRILVVEDEAIVAMVIKRRLKDLGYIVSGIASTGKDAIIKVEGTFPDLVLMDIRLKGDMDDGYILKPFTEKDLSTTIEIALHKFRKEKGN
ncbi:MAG: response regulator receiver protein [Methanohalophilus sp.]|nr:MAG: response regulator receiver protein [Methanohalophilus sp.]